MYVTIDNHQKKIVFINNRSNKIMVHYFLRSNIERPVLIFADEVNPDRNNSEIQ